MMRNEWDGIWGNFEKRNFFGRRLINSLKKIISEILDEINFPKKSKILDLGCGVGETLLGFRGLGFKNVMGIDSSINALKICEKRGLKINKDVFLMTGSNTSFNDDSFDFVYSDGVIEHLKDIEPFVKEICRISKK